MIYNNLQDFKEIIEGLKRQWKTIVRTNGCFDILHPGHIETFKKSKEYGDILVIGLNSDKSPYRKTKPWRPINDEKFRATMLQAVRFIDFVYIYDEDTPIFPISELLPDVLLKWWDYNLEEIVWYKEVVENGGRVVTIPVVEGYSTTNIVNKLRNI